VQDAAIAAIRAGHSRYTVTQGIQELRTAVLATEKARTGIVHDGVLITSGVSGGLLLVLMALVNPGDKVAIADPYFVMYKHLARLLGGEPVYIDTYPDFRVTAERLERAGAADAKLLLLNSPSNPTAQIARESDLREIADWAARNDVFIISDEIYSVFCYDAPFHSVAEFTDDVLLLSGMSKSAAMTGWRLGYAIGPEPLIGEMTKLQQFSFVCAPSMVQWGALAALDCPPTEHVADYHRKRDLVYNGLRDKFRIEMPSGAFYAFPEAPGGDGDAFCRRAIERNLLIIPGSVFSERATHFRISFAAEDDVIKRGVAVMNELADEF
jgi:aspartate/methionine/tyrosine aminotransferase